MAYTIGIDVGGTFTDVVLGSGDDTWRAKAPTDPADFGRGVLEGCRLVAEAAGQSLNALLPQVARFGLGTTAVTNALTVKQGLRVGLLTTSGFEDTVAAARSRRVHVGGFLEVPWQPVERRCIAGIAERVGRGGVVVEPLDEAQAAAEIDRLVRDEQVESMAVSFLWSFANPSHERRVVELVRERHPSIPVFGGADLHPTIREYERTMVAVLNAFCGGALEGIDSLANALADHGMRVPVLLLQANGGTITLPEARRAPLVLNASGPSAGVVAAAEVAGLAGYTGALCGDAGGTSFDVALVENGQPQRRQRGELHGVITAQSAIDVESIGSAGGSIARVDERGLLCVGPESARALPGPACYGRGGTRPTLTDALVVLGYIDPSTFLKGGMPLDVDAARAACAAVGAPIGLTAEAVAFGVRSIAIEQMVKASRLLLGSSGLDPRRLAFVSYGGSGPLFAADIARAANIPVVLVPDTASVLSAFGAAAAEVRRERFIPIHTLISELDTGAMIAAMKDLAAEVDLDVSRDGVQAEQRDVRFEADMRFYRQAFELTVNFDGPDFDPTFITEQFQAQYRQRYGQGAMMLQTPVELAALRAVGIGQLPRAVFARDERGPHDAIHRHRRPVHLTAGGATSIEVFDATELHPGSIVNGPAIIDQGDTTVFVPADFRGRLDSHRTLHLEAVT